jgi:hypothetical protein
MTCKKEWKPLLKLFKKEVTDKAAQIDPDQEYTWRGLVIGWAVAKGMGVEEALDFSLHAIYDTDLA